MDFNNNSSSEVKGRREKFSISIRRSEQDRFFGEHRKRMITGSLADSLGTNQNAGAEARSLNPEIVCRFADLREHLIELLSQRRINESLDVLNEAKSMISAHKDPNLVPLAEFFESNMTEVIISMTHMPEMVNYESIRNVIVGIISNLFAAPLNYTQQLIESGVLGFLSEQICHADAAMTDNILWSLANLLGDNVNYFGDMINCQIWNNILEKINLYIKNEKIARTASWFISNALRYMSVPQDMVR
jgi:hypothetical protein